MILGPFRRALEISPEEIGRLQRTLRSTSLSQAALLYAKTSPLRVLFFPLMARPLFERRRSGNET
jgi:hypothetical protein